MVVTHPPSIPTNRKDSPPTYESALEAFPLSAEALSGLHQVPETSLAEGSPTFRSNPGKAKLVKSFHPSIVTLADLFGLAVSTFGSKPCLSVRKPPSKAYRAQSYNQIKRLRDAFGSGLRGLLPEPDAILAVFASNCLEWIVTELACAACSITTTALFDSLGPEAITHIVSLTQCRAVVAGKGQLLQFLQRLQTDRITTVKFVIVILEEAKPLPSGWLTLAAELGVTLLTFNEVVASGSRVKVESPPPLASTLYTICFTSGTLGLPKGVELTHGNAIAAVTALYMAVPRYDSEHTDYRSLCILPLAHVIQRLMVHFELSFGGTVFLPLYPGDASKLLADISLVKPTHLTAVPQVYNRIQAGIVSKVKEQGFIGKLLHDKCINYKTNKFTAGRPVTNHWLFDRQYTRKIKKVCGLESVRVMATGSAPLHPDAIRLLRYLLNAKFYQGYGLTESFGPITCLLPGDELHPESSGYINATAEIRLRDVPEMNYRWASNRTGEICLRGPQILQGYYKDEALMASLFDKDGWFFTGDIALMDDKGRVTIIDRRKDLLKMAQGLYVSPGKIEGAYLLATPSILRQIFVHAHPLELFVVAIVVVNEPGCLDAIPDIQFLDETNAKALNADTAFRRSLLSHINRAVEKLEVGVNGMERVRNIRLFFNHDSPDGGRNMSVNYGFTVANDLLSPSLKPKRLALRSRFAKELKAMYVEGDITHE